MKKVLLTLGAILFAFSSQAFANGATIGFVVSTLNNPFFVSMRDGAAQEADKNGHTLLVLDSQNDPVREMSNIDDLIVRGVDLVLINPTDADASSRAVMMLNRAGIPAITLDRGITRGKVVSHIASDNAAGGESAAKFINQQIPSAKLIQLEGIPGTSAARERGQGFEQGIKRYNLTLLASQPANFDRTQGLNVMENLLVANRDVQAVFAQNDEMALGAIQAIAASGRSDIIIVGFDGTQDGINAVQSGQMSATIAQQPDFIGALGVQTAQKVLNGDSVDATIPVPLKVIQ